MINNTNLAFNINEYNQSYSDIPINKDYIINQKIDISVLEERYQNDIWDISNWDEYKEWCKNVSGRQIKNIKFIGVENENIRNELKLFMHNVITRKNISISTIRAYTDAFSKIDAFVKMIPYHLNSLLEIKIDTIADIVEYNFSGTQKFRNVLNQYFEFYKEKYNLLPKFNKNDDLWNLDYIGFNINYVKSMPVHTLDFSSITIPDFNKAAKIVLYHFLPTKSISTIKSYRIGFMYLNNFIQENTKIRFLKDLDRKTIEHFVFYIKENISPSRLNSMISGLSVCFETLKLLNYPMPNVQLIYKFDFTKVVRNETVKVLSDNELKQINKNIEKMDFIYRNILFVFEQTGTRISETLTLKKNYLIKREKTNGEVIYALNYLQHKTKKLNCIPIDELTAEVLIRQIEINDKEYGNEWEYIFSINGKTPIIYKTFREYYKKFIEENNILSDDGNLLSSKLHIFRATRATNLANRGISYDTIRLMLGHANMNSLYHYIKIHSQTMSDMMKPIFDEMTYNYENRNNKLIEDVNTSKKEMLQSSPLVNGMCCKNPLEGCEHSNICYTCDFFKGNKKYLQVYENQLTNAKNSLEMAKLNNFTRIIEQNETLINGLERIIKEIKES